MRQRRPGLVMTTILAAFTLLAATGCRKQKPSILLISIDSLRADEVARVENGRPVAPTLAAFAKESVRFTSALAAAPWTTPSMMAVMTGMPAPAHGVEEHDRALAPSVPVLAERLQRARWRTGAVSPALTLRPEYGFSRGFDDYDFEPLGHDVVTSPKLSGKTLHLLDRYKDDRFMVWVHFWDPHYNYIPPAPYDAQYRTGVKPAREDVQCLKWIENPLPPDGALYLHGQYRGEIAYTDRFVREILDNLEQLGRADDTIVVILGDHGESFQAHGWLGHTIRVDQDMTHVPIMIRWPGHLAPAEIDGAVEIAQIGPTLLKLTGLPHEDFGLAKPLPLTPADAAQDASALTRTLRMGCYTGLLQGKWKYQLDHRTCGETLFDLSADPGETHDLAPREAQALAALRNALRARFDEIAAAKVPHAMLPQQLIDETEAALRSIGYVQAATGGSGQGAEIVCEALPDPTKYKHDAFGDLQVFQPCAPDGAQRCLQQLP
jgi:arylsulfatase A-like enzyme